MEHSINTLIIEILDPSLISNSKLFTFHQPYIQFDKIQTQIAIAHSLELGSFHFTYLTDDGDELDLSNSRDLDEALIYFDDGDSSIISSFRLHVECGGNKTITLKLKLVLHDLPNLSERTTSSAGDDDESELEWKEDIIRHLTVDKGKNKEKVRTNGRRNGTRREESGTHSFFPPVPPPANTQYPSWMQSTSTLSNNSYGPPGFSAPSTTDQKSESIPRRKTYSSTSSSSSSGKGSTPATTPDISPSTQLPNSAPPTYASGSDDKSKGISNSNDDISSISETSDLTYISTSSASQLQYQTHLRQPTFSEHVTSAPQESYNVSNFIARIKSSSKLSTPSIFSSLPDGMVLKCSGCSERMGELRYICSSCGPVIPVEEEDSEDEISDDGTEVLREGGKVEDFDDSLGVMRACHIAIPLSPLSFFKTSPIDLSGMLPDIEEEEEEEIGGFELCSNCVETVGVTHASEMSRLEERRNSNSTSSERGALVELRHAFSECMKVQGSHLHGWREVDYDDAPHCTICSQGPIVTNRFKCLSCPSFELCISCYKTVEDIHPIHTFLSVPDLPARPSTPIIPIQPNDVASSSRDMRVSPEEFRRAFLRARGVEGDSRGNEVSSFSFADVKHVGVICFGCLTEIIGPRFSCASCSSFDLCFKCELIEPPLTSPDGRHEASHIILKIKIPVISEEINSANARARILASGNRLPPPPQPQINLRTNPWTPVIQSPMSPSVHTYPPYHETYTRVPLPLPPPPPHYLGTNLSPLTGSPTWEDQSLPGAYPLITPPNSDRCNSCDEILLDVRWLCGNCPSRVFLCSTCENSSHIVHDSLHCFLRIKGQLHPSLPIHSQLLPILYDLDSLNRSFTYSNDELNYHETALHPNVLCDYCLDTVRGWLRCVNCDTSFDICEACLDRSSHFEGVHVFVKFNRRVDIQLLKELTGISTGSTPKALIPYSILDSQ